MTVSEIPDSNNVVRYVGFRGIRGATVDGNQFCRRPNEDGLSVNWLEKFSHLPKDAQIAKVRHVVHLELGQKAVFAELNIDEVKQYLQDELPDIQFVSDPLPANDRFPYVDPSHTQIMGLPSADEEEQALLIGDMIAKRVKALHPAIL